MTMTNVKIPKAYEEYLNIPDEYKDDAYKYWRYGTLGALLLAKIRD